MTWKKFESPEINLRWWDLMLKKMARAQGKMYRCINTVKKISSVTFLAFWRLGPRPTPHPASPYPPSLREVKDPPGQE